MNLPEVDRFICDLRFETGFAFSFRLRPDKQHRDYAGQVAEARKTAGKTKSNPRVGNPAQRAGLYTPQGGNGSNPLNKLRG